MNAGTKFKVTFLDGTVAESKVRPVNQVAAEREFGGSFLDFFEKKELNRLYWVAWHATTHGSGDHDAWLETVDEIDFVFGDAVDPTPPVPSDS